ncbi:MAG TPA: hypothetical protein VE133_00430 [Candidatus Sulfotelmatobacter sp.]|nr:hypothetical protein [Candidatus Sulfotelmatobacter sp.]
MRLVDNLRKAEKKGAMTIRRGVERAREEWADVERRIRQRMRVYPQKREAATAGVAAMDTDEITVPDTRNTGQRPIISVHGRDLTEN